MPGVRGGPLDSPRADADRQEQQREAAEIYHDYLLGRQAQEIAPEEWLRPADESIPLSGDLTLEGGISKVCLSTEGSIFKVYLFIKKGVLRIH